MFLREKSFVVLIYLQMGLGYTLDRSRQRMEVIKLSVLLRSVAERNVELPALKSRSRREICYSLNCLGPGPHRCHGKRCAMNSGQQITVASFGLCFELVGVSRECRCVVWALLQKTSAGGHPCTPAAQLAPLCCLNTQCVPPQAHTGFTAWVLTYTDRREKLKVSQMSREYWWEEGRGLATQTEACPETAIQHKEMWEGKGVLRSAIQSFKLCLSGGSLGGSLWGKKKKKWRERENQSLYFIAM